MKCFSRWIDDVSLFKQITPTSKWTLFLDEVSTGLIVSESLYLVVELDFEILARALVGMGVVFSVERLCVVLVLINAEVFEKTFGSAHKLAWLNVSICDRSTQM